MQKWDMNLEKYKYIFLKTDDSFIGSLGGNHDIAHYHKKKDMLLSHFIDFETKDTMSETSMLFIDSSDYSKSSNYIKREFNTLINIPLTDKMKTGIPLHLKLELEVKQLSEDTLIYSPLLVIEAATPDTRYFYYASKIYDVPNFSTNEWKKYNFSFNVPVESSSGSIKIYLWNKYLQEILINDIQLELYVLN